MSTSTPPPPPGTSYDGPISDKNWTTTLLLILFLGGLGAHRFYVGKIGTAILFILTAGGFLVWFIIDLIKIIQGTFTDSEGRPIPRP